jgi:hypothetical protein
MLTTHIFNGNDLFWIRQCDEALPGNPVWANVDFCRRESDPQKLRGPGIYAIFFDAKLIYVGKFLGHRTSPFSQNISRARWDKHLGTMTLRGRHISWPGQTLDRIVRDFPDATPVQEMRAATRETLCRDRGMQSSYNRFRFGDAHWARFSTIDASVLGGFRFLYVQVQNTPLVSDLGIDGIRAAVSEAENILVSRLRPQCNGSVPFGSGLDGHELEYVAEQIATVLEAKLLIPPTDPFVPPCADDSGDASLCAGDPAIAVAGNARGCPAEELWYQQFPADGAARHAVDCIVRELGPTCEVHFTYTAGADLRIRATRADGRARNIFTMQYRTRTNDFCCRALAAPLVCQQAGFQAVETADPLPSKFILNPGLAQKESVLSVIGSAIEGFLSNVDE